MDHFIVKIVCIVRQWNRFTVCHVRMILCHTDLQTLTKPSDPLTFVLLERLRLRSMHILSHFNVGIKTEKEPVILNNYSINFKFDKKPPCSTVPPLDWLTFTLVELIYFSVFF